jgi:2'-5' RNA ligase
VSYLLEVRLGGDTKRQIREIMRDVADRFEVGAFIDRRPVPHMTLFGPFFTDSPEQVKMVVEATFGDYTKIPYRLAGFNHFDNRVVYVDVGPSEQLLAARSELADRLGDIATSTTPLTDHAGSFDYHVTVAFKRIEQCFPEIWSYVTDQYQPMFDEYVERVTLLQGRNMVTEYDVPTNRWLDPDFATSRRSWNETENAFADVTTDLDHDGLEPPGPSATDSIKRGVYLLRSYV